MTSRWNKKVPANDYVYPNCKSIPSVVKDKSSYKVSTEALSYTDFVMDSRAWFVVYTVHACVVPRLNKEHLSSVPG